MQKSFVAEIMLLNFCFSPHYRDKQDVAMRLAVGAMHHVYGDEKMISDGPYPTAVYHSSVVEVTVQYSTSQYLTLHDTQSFQVGNQFLAYTNLLHLVLSNFVFSHTCRITLSSESTWHCVFR